MAQSLRAAETDRGKDQGGAACAPPPMTIDHEHRAAAFLVDVAAGIGDRETRAHAERFMAALIAGSPRFARAIRFFDRVSEDSAGDGLAVSAPPPEPSEGGWAVSICRVSDQLDDLVAMAEPSSFADPGELLDPTGEFEPDLCLMARIAAVAAGHGDTRITRKTLGWLRRWATREEREKRFLERGRERSGRWPFNAIGPMGEVDGTVYAMRYGGLSEVERHFRATMVRARHWFHVSRRQTLLEKADRLLASFLARSDRLPKRMHGLIVAARASLLLHDLSRRFGDGRPRLRIGRALERQLAEAERLLMLGGETHPEDRGGLANLRNSFRVFAGTKRASA